MLVGDITLSSISFTLIFLDSNLPRKINMMNEVERDIKPVVEDGNVLPTTDSKQDVKSQGKSFILRTVSEVSLDKSYPLRTVMH